MVWRGIGTVGYCVAPAERVIEEELQFILLWTFDRSQNPGTSAPSLSHQTASQ